MKYIEDYNVITRFDHVQYWEGAGLANTDWDDFAVGFGFTTTEAYEDALNQLEAKDWRTFPMVDLEHVGMQCECPPVEDWCEHGWLVSVYVKEI